MESAQCVSQLSVWELSDSMVQPQMDRDRFRNVSNWTWSNLDSIYVVLLRIPKSCKRTDSDGFVKKSADPDSVSDS